MGDMTGIDLKLEMDKRLMALEEQFRKEKLEADNAFEQQRKAKDLFPRVLSLYLRTPQFELYFILGL
jgi:hypothetical protein